MAVFLAMLVVGDHLGTERTLEPVRIPHISNVWKHKDVDRD